MRRAIASLAAVLVVGVSGVVVAAQAADNGRESEWRIVSQGVGNGSVDVAAFIRRYPLKVAVRVEATKGTRVNVHWYLDCSGNPPEDRVSVIAPATVNMVVPKKPALVCAAVVEARAARQARMTIRMLPSE